MSGDSDYGKGLALGDIVIGQTVGVVALSRNPEFREGEFVVTNGGWQEYSLTSGRSAVRLDPEKLSPLDALGLLGTSGLTAYVGLLVLGMPREGKTVLVSAASGSVGSVVGQCHPRCGASVVWRACATKIKALSYRFRGPAGVSTTPRCARRSSSFTFLYIRDFDRSGER